MRISWLLFKNYIINFTKYNELKYGSKNHKSKYVLQYIFIVIAILTTGILCENRLWNIMSKIYTKDMLLDCILLPMVFGATFFAICSSAIHGVGILYLDNNLENLFSMPIKVYEIVVSKFIIIYFYIVLISLGMIYPVIIYYGILEKASYYFFIIGFIDVVILTIVPVSLGIFLGILIYKIFKNLILGNSRFKIFLEVGILVVLICLVGFGSSEPELIGQFFLSLNQKLSTSTETLQKLLELDLDVLVPFYLESSVLGFLSLYVINNTYKKTYYKLTLRADSAKKYEIGNVKYHTKVYTLVQRERKRYFSIPIYVINTMLGAIFVFIYVLESIAMKDTVKSYFVLLEQYLGHSVPIGVCNACIITALIILTNTTYACISIEGKGYEIIKSYPIKEKEFLGSKIVSHLLLTIPVIIIANIIETIIFKLSMKECVIGFLLPISFTYFTGMLGCVLNITFPNFNWKNISFIVKQSIAAISSVFFSIGVVGVSFWVMFKNFNDNLMEAIYCLAMLMIVIDIGVSILLSLRAKKVCENLQLK